MKILLVDDSPMQQKIAKIYLEKGEGYEVVSAFNGEDALNAVLECKPDLMLLDIEMPGMDGITVLATLKSNPAISDIPVIMCTASEDMTVEEKASELGAAGFIKKPHGFSTLKNVIKNLHLMGA